MTLVELVVVVVILVTLAALVVRPLVVTADQAREDSTRVSLRAVRDAIVAYRDDVRRMPSTLADLLQKPALVDEYDERTRRGWRGPYVHVPLARYVVGPMGQPGDDDFVHSSFTIAYGTAGDPAIPDAFGRPIVLQIPDVDSSGVPPSSEEARHARLVSAGLDGVFQASTDVFFPTLGSVRDDLVHYVDVADLRAP